MAAYDYMNEEQVGEFDLLADARQLFSPITAARIQAAFGGGTLYISPEQSAKSPLGRVIGHAPAQTLADSYGGIRVYIPGGVARERAQTVRWMTVGGFRAGEIATSLNITERQVFRLKAALRTSGELPPYEHKGRPK